MKYVIIKGMKKVIWSLIAGVVGIASIGANASNFDSYDANNSSNSSYTSTVNDSSTIREPVIETKVLKETEVIPYDTVTQNDASMAQGTSRVVVEGANGERTKTFEVTYTDGKETSRKLISADITKAPVNRVVANGTYVAPTTYCENGTYVNSSGNTVCRPSEHNTGGATAICRDGTYSYSQHRSGTCSHHGGVMSWL